MEKKAYKNPGSYKGFKNKNKDAAAIDYNKVGIDTIVYLFKYLKKMIKGWECERLAKLIIKRIEERKIAKIYGQDLIEIVNHAKSVILHYTLHEFIVQTDDYKPITDLIKTVCDFLQIKIYSQPAQINSETVEVHNEDPFGERPMLTTVNENPRRGGFNGRSRRRNQNRMNQPSLTQNNDVQPIPAQKRVIDDIRIMPNPIQSQMYNPMQNPISFSPIQTPTTYYAPAPTMVANRPRLPPDSLHQVDTIDTNISIIEQYIQKMKDCSENYKKQFTCPLSRKPYIHPVTLLEDKVVYEEDYIKDYIKKYSKSPSTNQTILYPTFQIARETIDLMDSAKSEFLVLKNNASKKKEQTDKIIVFEKNIGQINRYDRAINTLKLINIGCWFI